MTTATQPCIKGVSADAIRMNVVRQEFTELTGKSASYLAAIVKKLMDHVDSPRVPVPDVYGVYARTFESAFVLRGFLGVDVVDSTVALYLQRWVDLVLDEDSCTIITVKTYDKFVEISLSL